MPDALLYLLLVVVVGIVLFAGWLMLVIANVPPLYEPCSLCNDPLVHGYEAIHEGKPICRSCCRRHRIRAWYWTPEVGDGFMPGDSLRAIQEDRRKIEAALNAAANAEAESHEREWLN